MSQFTPSYNPASRKSKGLHALFGGLRCPFFFTSAVMVEGAPVMLKNTAGNTKCYDNYEVEAPTMGASEGAKVIGLAMQLTYEEASSGQLAQLAGFHFANDTSQRLDGMPIGVLTGTGWGLLRNFDGTVTSGKQMAVGPSGKLVDVDYAGVAEGDYVPVWAETGGSGTEIRVRFDFPFNSTNGL